MNTTEKLTLSEAVKIAYSTQPDNMNKYLAPDLVITGVILHTHPECIEKRDRLPRHFAKALSRELQMNRSQLSRSIPALIVRYNTCPEDKRAVVGILGALSEGDAPP